MTEVDIGSGKTARRAYELRDIAVVPSRRTRDREDVNTTWEIDAYRLASPLLASAAVVTTPGAAIAAGRAGAAGILDLEGACTRFDDPAPALAAIAAEPDPRARAARREHLFDGARVQPELIVQRVREIKDAGAPCLVSLRPQSVEEMAAHVLKADPDLFVINGRVVSAEHVSRSSQPLNLKRFIREFEIPVLVGGCASFQAALHLMRAGAVGILAGVRGIPLATAIADAAGARMSHLVETGVYVHVIANGGIASGAEVSTAIACGADAAIVEMEPAGIGDAVETLRRDMAASGHETIKEFQKADIVVVR